MTQKVLIANRGEIALRALKSLQGIRSKTVAIYSAGDKELKHLQAGR